MPRPSLSDAQSVANGSSYYNGSSVVPLGGSTGLNSSAFDIGDDLMGYAQSEWDLEKTKELLAEQRAYNSAEAEKTRKWQEEMSNTAYQRAVQDLEDAGLNKWLAVTGQANGASASTPSGATASSSSGDASTPNSQLMRALISAIANIASSAVGMFRIRVK